MIDEIIKSSDSKLTDNRVRQKKYYNRHSIVGGQADWDVKYCRICNRCWEYNRNNNGNKSIMLIHYSDFVTYGKVREICPLCEGMNYHCDVCETDRKDVTKQDGIWSCTDCDKRKRNE